MFLEGQTIDGERAARGLSLWMGGLAGWLLVALGNGAFRWYLFSDLARGGSPELTRGLSLSLQVLGIGAGVALVAGAWRYLAATGPGSVMAKAVVVVLASDPLFDAVYLTLSLTQHPGGYAEWEAVYEVLGHLWTVQALLRVAAFVWLFARMARLGESQGRLLAPARVWAAIGACVAWGLLVATAKLELFNFGGVFAGVLFHIVPVALLAGTALALLHAHRAHLRAGAIAAPSFASPHALSGFAAAGRGLGRYHAAIVSQVAFVVLGSLVTLAVARAGDPEAARGMMMVVLVVGLVIQLVAVAGLSRFAAQVPVLHAARGPAVAAATLQVLNALVGLVTTALVVRAFSTNRLSVIFDLQDQLPALEGVSAILGCLAAVAVLSAIEKSGALTESAGVLKVAIPTLGVSVMVFKLLDHRDFGAAATLGLGVILLVAAVSTAVAFLRTVRRAADAMQMSH